MKEALIIFVRNPVLGKVKSRLASTIGGEKALQVYKHLLNHTKSITEKLPLAKFVYYADAVTENDIWNGYEKKLQCGNTLGERMQMAFSELFSAGYSGICIIGSDCHAISSADIESAFEKLNQHDLVIGPAADGGYYLLGCKKNIPELFINKKWGSPAVLEATLADAVKLKLSVYKLQMLNDIDEEKDLAGSGLAFLLD